MIPRLAAFISAKRRTLRTVLLVCAAVELSIALWDLTGGGFHVELAGIRLSSWDPYKPFRIGMIALVLAMWIHDREASPETTTWHRLARTSPWIAGAAAVASIAIGISYGIQAAGGADAYGYVSQAHAWASGHLLVQNRLAGVTKEVGPAVAPLGYQLTADESWLAPIYSPGLPLMMAAAIAVAGGHAVYLVVPLLGGLAVWLTYLLARRLADAHTAMTAALLVAFSPIFLFQSLEPMSDVPVTACWLAAWFFATSDRRWSPIAAGLAVSVAVLTRPNLVPLTLVIALVVARQRPAITRLALFAAAVVPGCVFIGILNNHLYGSPLRSGYGPLETLYAWDRFGDNLRRYTSWAIELHTPVILLAFAAPFVARVRASLSMLAFTACLLLAYVFYFVFDSWPFLRFLLPAIPLLLILTSGVVVRGLEQLPLAFRGTLLFLICTLLPGWYLVTARDHTVFAIHRAEHRYVAIAEAIDRQLEPNAVVVTVLHSGSIRFYADRATVRWDLIEPNNLDFSLKALREGGYTPYLVLEDFEESPYRERFGGRSAYGALDWPPALEYADISTTRVYAFGDRQRHEAGECIRTRRITSASTPESRTSPPCGSPKS